MHKTHNARKPCTSTKANAQSVHVQRTHTDCCWRQEDGGTKQGKEGRVYDDGMMCDLRLGTDMNVSGDPLLKSCPKDQNQNKERK